jgi:hypothetical protein
MKFDRVAALLLLVLGILTLGTGAYFLFFRPPMLPEDVRLTGMDPQLLQPAMVDWLRIVFRTWGGFMVAFGILIVSIAGYMITSRPALLSWGVVFAVLVAFGRFLASNIAIQSDHLSFIGGLFAIAIVAALRVALNARHTSGSGDSRDRENTSSAAPPLRSE